MNYLLRLMLVASLALCFSPKVGAALEPRYLVGTFSVDGSNLFGESAFNFTGGTYPLIIIEASGNVFIGHASKDIFVQEIGCSLLSSTDTLTITPSSATELYIDVRAPTTPLLNCFPDHLEQLDTLISNVAKDKNSFTLCMANIPSRCGTFVRNGTKPPTPKGEVCKSGLTGIKAPQVKVTNKSVVITDVSNDSGVKNLSCKIIHKTSTKSKTIKYNLTGKGKVTKGGLVSGFWSVQCTENCTSRGSATLISTGFNIK